jgi:hypothetical protein
MPEEPARQRRGPLETRPRDDPITQKRPPYMTRWTASLASVFNRSP